MLRCMPLFMFSLVALVPNLCRAGMLDLAEAVVVSPLELSSPERKAVEMLIDEVQKRTQIRWQHVHAWPSSSQPVIAVGPASALSSFAGKFARELSSETTDNRAEGYRLRVKPVSSAVFVIGNDARGVLFGVGRLLRGLKMSAGKVELADDTHLTTSPKIPLRGHQLGYRPKTNSYDAWNVEMWEQYFRDLIVFGMNAVELIPPRSDDADDSPHFPLPKMEMMVEMSRMADEYDLDVWIWYPALDEDYSDPKTVEFALAEWSEVFKKLPRVDALFVPGGDPGHTRPKYLMALLEKQSEVLHRYHPEAGLWVAPQGFSKEWLDEFYAIVNNGQPDWLNGLVFGPQVRVSLPELRAAVSSRYPIRRYPDITHCRHCQYPVQDWDLAYSRTEAREIINPRPVAQAKIFRLFQDDAFGYITYSEGCHDDVNKVVWSCLGWDPNARVIDILREYSRYFVGEEYEDDFAQGLLALEKNWEGPLLTNSSVDTTLETFQSMEKSASPQLMLNWRFQQVLYRAYFDAFIRSRLLDETSLEKRALETLRSAPKIGSAEAMSKAEKILDQALTDPAAPDYRARVFELAESLFQSIRMQMSVEKYKAVRLGRGTSLDTIDRPLNNRLWLKRRFSELRLLSSEEERLAGIDEIVNWTNPGPGGFYDDLGNLTQQPHLVRGPGFDNDPAHLESSLVGFGFRGDLRPDPISWWRHAESLNDAPLRMHYQELDPQAEYKIRVTYAGELVKPNKLPLHPPMLRLLADDEIEVHPYMHRQIPPRPAEFDIPPQATSDGELTLTWYREQGLGGNGRGCQVAEVWLMKK